MSKLFSIKILTPERVVYDGDVEYLIVTTTDGRYSFLANHVPIVMPLASGTLSFKAPNETKDVFNSEGFLEVHHEGILVYVQACETPEEIDKRRAAEARERAEERMRQKQSMKEYQQSKMALARAMARLQITKIHGIHK